MDMPLDEDKLDELLEGIKQTLMKKNALYGDAVFEFGEHGILIRAYDKAKRLMTLLGNRSWVLQQQLIANGEEYEAMLDDAWLDLAGYAVLALYFRRWLRHEVFGRNGHR